MPTLSDTVPPHSDGSVKLLPWKMTCLSPNRAIFTTICASLLYIPKSKLKAFWEVSLTKPSFLG